VAGQHLKGLGNQISGNAIDFADHAGICRKDDRLANFAEK